MDKNFVPRLVTTNYVRAETEADMCAGDLDVSHAVVEDFTTDRYLLMTLAEAERYVELHDAEIQHTAIRPSFWAEEEKRFTQTIPFTDGESRCTTCHRAAHHTGTYSGTHWFTYVNRAQSQS